jgi:hypothetical protein
MANQQFEPVCGHRRKTFVDQDDYVGVRTRDRRIDFRRGAPVDRGRRGVDATRRRRRGAGLDEYGVVPGCAG